MERDSEGRFSTDLIIQHHDMIVTSADIGLQVPFFVSECFRDFPFFLFIKMELLGHDMTASSRLEQKREFSS